MCTSKDTICYLEIGGWTDKQNGGGGGGQMDEEERDGERERGGGNGADREIVRSDRQIRKSEARIKR